MDLNYEDVQNILKIVDASSLEELHLEIGGFKLIVRKKGGRVSAEVERVRPEEGSVQWVEGAAGLPPQKAREAARSPQVSPSGAARPGGVEVKAPMVGTFYRAPAPGAPPFVEVGHQVTEDDTVGIIEVMKLMNSIRAGCRGRVLEICAENGAMVEFGQVLMVVESSA